MRATRRRFIAATAATTLVLAAVPAFALTLDEARDGGLVAEGMNGYLIAVDGSARALVDDINRQRRAVYQQTAAETGQPLAIVETLAGERQISRARPGWLIETPSGIRAK